MRGMLYLKLEATDCDWGLYGLSGDGGLKEQVKLTLCSMCTFIPGAEWLAGSTGSYLGPGYTVPPWVTEACHMHRIPPGETLLLIPGLKQLSRKKLSPSRIGSHAVSLSSSLLGSQRSSYFLSWSSPWLSQWLSLYCILGYNFLNYDFLFFLLRRESKGSIPFTLGSIGNRYHE